MGICYDGALMAIHTWFDYTSNEFHNCSTIFQLILVMFALIHMLYFSHKMLHVVDCERGILCDKYKLKVFHMGREHDAQQRKMYMDDVKKNLNRQATPLSPGAAGAWVVLRNAVKKAVFSGTKAE
jgi:hypothetical protein